MTIDMSNCNGQWPARPRDETTRYLCAATHLDPDYADRAIREFLIEPTRPVPASPGVDAVAVLGEAVAARTRRKLRDLALIALAIGVVLVASVEFLVGWLALALLIGVPATTPPRRTWHVAAYLAVLLAAGALAYLAPRLLDLPSYQGFSDLGAVAVAVAMLAVLLADRFVVWGHLHRRFWPNRVTRVVPWLRDRPILRFSPSRQLTQLRRHAGARPGTSGQSAEPVRLVVYREFVPFVGAGTVDGPWSIAVPLEELPDAARTAELTTESLYAGIHEEITSLRSTNTLAPGRRLGELGPGEVVIVSAHDLIDHLDDAVAADFLKRPGVAPFGMVHPERARAIRAEPLEWARYYRCYQVETWDRDLVVTVFVHVAVGRGALYVEWTPCVLLPVRKEYRAIDRMSRSVLRPFGQGVLDLLAVPASLPGRLVRLLSFLRPVPQERGIPSPELYGSGRGLRELAADDDVHNYFQLLDVDRYVKMLESRLVLAVSRMMRAGGYSPATFDAQAASVVNNNVQIAGSVGGNVVAGTGNRIGDAAIVTGGRG
ncbi:hypothetical protein [Actinophytocola sp.]|uniref:hypothetical protein n=1 Tax=Actinophytocola sp. TaxID=1872138 RepID=UPI002ED2B841